MDHRPERNPALRTDPGGSKTAARDCVSVYEIMMSIKLFHACVSDVLFWEFP